MSTVLALVAGFPIYQFALFVDLGIVLGVALALWLGRCLMVPATRLLDCLAIALFAALIGGRLQYVAEHWGDYAGQPVTALYLWEGGLSLPGALTLAVVSLALVGNSQHLALSTLTDILAPAAALAQGIGRLGCVSAGCAVGKAISTASGMPWLLLPDASGLRTPRFPSQYAEAAGECALAVALTVICLHSRTRGWVAPSYLLGYGALRLAAEPLRGDSTFLGPFASASLWAAACLVLGLALLDRRWWEATQRRV